MARLTAAGFVTSGLTYITWGGLLTQTRRGRGHSLSLLSQWEIT